MILTVTEALKRRVSSNLFDVNHTMSEAEIAELVSLAVEAPSSYNIQHWRIVAVTDKAQKQALRAAAFGQPKVEEAAVTFVICGDYKAHEAFIERLRGAAAAGHMDAAVVESIAGQVGYFYGQTAMAREEAVRSAGLVGMALMLGAEERGLASGPMIGFNPAEVAKVLGLSERYFPAIMIAVGKGREGNGPRKPRLQAAEVLRFNKGDF